jgi:hypothetical protein
MADAQSVRLSSRQAEAEAEFLTLTDSTSPQDGVSTVPLSLLVVDDDEHTREVCRAVAAGCGMKTAGVSTGLIGMSPRMERVYKMIEKVSQRDQREW